MGYGDELMGSGIARGAHLRGKRVAFGDGNHIYWHSNAHEIFLNNPNVAPPGSEKDGDLEWVEHYSGHRLYHSGRAGGEYTYNMDFRPRAGEVFFTPEEAAFAEALRPDFVVVEASVKSTAPNKQWPRGNYQALIQRLEADGHRVVQLVGGTSATPLPGEYLITRTFRLALAALSRAILYVGGEGGLHHGAAALGVPAVVIFGGFGHPLVTGYKEHINLRAGDIICGRIRKCDHCQEAMRSIGVSQVARAAQETLIRSGHA